MSTTSFKRLRSAFLAIVMLFGIAALGCGGTGTTGGGTDLSSSSSGAASGPPAASSAINPATGGTVTVTSGPLAGAVVNVPPGALAVPTTITISPANAINAPAASMGPAIALGPSGTQFLKPLTITVPFSATALAGRPGASPSSLVILHQSAGGAVQVIGPTSANPNTGTLTFQLSSFSTVQPAALTPEFYNIAITTPSNTSVNTPLTGLTLTFTQPAGVAGPSSHVQSQTFANGTLFVTCDNNLPMDLTLLGGNGSASIGGTLTLNNSVPGAMTFNGLTINEPGTYQIQFSSRVMVASNGASTITSGSFTVGGGGASPTPGGTTLTSIVVNPPNPSVNKGNAQVFTAQGTFSDGSSQDISSVVTWSSSNSSVATISNTGVATVPATAQTGFTTITATFQGVSGSTTLTSIPTTREFVFSADGSAGTISSFQIAQSGALTLNNQITDPESLPAWVVTTPSGLFGFAGPVAGSTGNFDIQPFSVDPATGNLTALTPAAAAGTPLAAAVDLQGQYLFVLAASPGSTVAVIQAFPINGNGTLGTAVVASSSGELRNTFAPKMGFIPPPTISGAPTLLLLQNDNLANNLLSFMESTPPVLSTPVGTTVGGSLNDFAFGIISGVPYVWTSVNNASSNGQAYTFSSGFPSPSGSPQTITNSGVGNRVVYSPGNNVLYSLSTDPSNPITAYSINTSDGSIGAPVPAPSGTSGEATASLVDPADLFLVVMTQSTSPNSNLFTLPIVGSNVNSIITGGNPQLFPQGLATVVLTQ